MRVKHHRALLLGIVCAGLALAGCGSSSSSSSAPGVSSTSITFGTHQPLTGPAAPGYSEIAPASQAFFDYAERQRRRLRAQGQPAHQGR